MASVDEDPLSIGLIIAVGITTLLAVIGWLAFIVQCCKNRKNGYADIELGSREAKAKLNSYVTIPINSSSQSDSGRSSSSLQLATPRSLPIATPQSSPHQSVRQNSVETYVVNIHRDTLKGGVARRESLL